LQSSVAQRAALKAGERLRKSTGSASIEACRASSTIVIICWRYDSYLAIPNLKIPNIRIASSSGIAVANIVSIVRSRLSGAMVWAKARIISQK
jgi:hypothetical protein